MSAPSVVIAGCGDVGSRLASQLLASEWEVHGLRRDISPRNALEVTDCLINLTPRDLGSRPAAV